MKKYTVYFTDSRWGFSVEIEALNKEEALKLFEEIYPQMYIEEITP